MLKKGIIPEETELNVSSYTNKQIENIFSTLKAKIPLGRKKQIVSNLNWAKIVWQSEEFFLLKPIPSVERMRRDDYEAFIKIEKDTKKLIDDLQGNKHRLLCAIAPLKDRLTEKEKIQKRINKLIDSLQQLSNELKIPISQRSKARVISDKTGRPPEIYRQAFILRLIDIYKDITGKKASPPSKYIKRENGKLITKYNSPSFRFIKACFNPIENINDGKLKEAIAQAIKKSTKEKVSFPF